MRSSGGVRAARLEILNVQEATAHAFAENAFKLCRTPSNFEIVSDNHVPTPVVEEVSSRILAEELAHVVEPGVRIEVSREILFAKIRRARVVNDEVDRPKVIGCL